MNTSEGIEKKDIKGVFYVTGSVSVAYQQLSIRPRL